jgi:Kef-type K+ transport system membrane component KefB
VIETPASRPGALVAAALLAALQVVGMVVYVVVIVLRAVGGDASSTTGVLLLGVLLLLWAGGLAVAVRGLWAVRRWSRSPLVVSELLWLPVSVPMIQSGLWVGWPLAALSLAALVALLSPPVTAALVD